MFNKIENYQINDILTLTCNHKFCKYCLIDQWEQLIIQKQIEEHQLKCPNNECIQPISYNELKYNINPQIFQKYDDYLVEKCKTQNNEIPFQCPNPKCSQKQESDYFNCPHCYNKYCILCKEFYHSKQTCQQYKENKNLTEEDIKTKKIMIENHYMPCPVCKIMIEKIRYCNFITCPSSQCNSKTFFCYLCGEKLNLDNHFNHFKNEDPYGIECNGIKKQPIQIENDNENSVNDKPCPNCQTTDPKICQIESNFNNQICYCISEKCNKSYYCLLCKKKIKYTKVYDHFIIQNCNRACFIY